MNKNKQSSKTYWLKHPDAAATSVSDAFAQASIKYSLSDSFFDDSFSNLAEREKFNRRVTFLYLTLVVCVTMAELAEDGSFSLFGLSLKSIYENRGFYLFFLSCISLYFSFGFLDLKSRRTTLELLYHQVHGETAKMASVLRWGNIMEYDYIPMIYSPRPNLEPTNVHKILRLLIIGLVYIWMLTVSAFSIGSIIYLYHQEWIYPSTTGSIYWFLYFSGFANWTLSLIIAIRFYIPLPYKLKTRSL